MLSGVSLTNFLTPIFDIRYETDIPAQRRNDDIWMFAHQQLRHLLTVDIHQFIIHINSDGETMSIFLRKVYRKINQPDLR